MNAEGSDPYALPRKLLELCGISEDNACAVTFRAKVGEPMKIDVTYNVVNPDAGELGTIKKVRFVQEVDE